MPRFLMSLLSTSFSSGDAIGNSSAAGCTLITSRHDFGFSVLLTMFLLSGFSAMLIGARQYPVGARVRNRPLSGY